MILWITTATQCIHKEQYSHYHTSVITYRLIVTYDTPTGLHMYRNTEFLSIAVHNDETWTTYMYTTFIKKLEAQHTLSWHILVHIRFSLLYLLSEWMSFSSVVFASLGSRGRSSLTMYWFSISSCVLNSLKRELRWSRRTSSEEASPKLVHRSWQKEREGEEREGRGERE